ncbi:hypothetical protein, partial [Mesorhizobium sp. M8A.F.Ca.ET.021.01.1.1]|uniref:hypothetical protein n=1 Tax=Mesorhizobium sp. M8A.F.Ca.ET.021.01.1.1 TaxID=2496757 RepID=UPI001AED0C94
FDFDKHRSSRRWRLAGRIADQPVAIALKTGACRSQRRLPTSLPRGRKADNLSAFKKLILDHIFCQPEFGNPGRKIGA